MNLRSLGVMLVLAGGFSSGVAWARTDDIKQRCDNCHTMHNSQDGKPMTRPSGLGPQGGLLRDSCYGCHTGVNNPGSPNPRTPYVFSVTEPTYGATGTSGGHNTLAGGSFYWTAQAGGDLTGHNVNGIATPFVGIPPGGTKTFDSSHRLTCAGVNGCHGVLTLTSETAAMSQTHHAVETAQPKDGSTLALSYRFLNGIAGFEDPDCELTVDILNHNQYKGIDRNSDSYTSSDSDKSISHLCAACHSNFHTETAVGAYGAANPWIRHPVDYDMGGLGGEFGDYGPGGTYNLATPLGSSNVSAIKDKVFMGAGDAIVVCVSCHRAHGSPYNYSLRWDYLGWPGGVGSYNGCGDCHTAKN